MARDRVSFRNLTAQKVQPCSQHHSSSSNMISHPAPPPPQPLFDSGSVSGSNSTPSSSASASSPYQPSIRFDLVHPSGPPSTYLPSYYPAPRHDPRATSWDAQTGPASRDLLDGTMIHSPPRQPARLDRPRPFMLPTSSLPTSVMPLRPRSEPEMDAEDGGGGGGGGGSGGGRTHGAGAQSAGTYTGSTLFDAATGYLGAVNYETETPIQPRTDQPDTAGPPHRLSPHCRRTPSSLPHAPRNYGATTLPEPEPVSSAYPGMMYGSVALPEQAPEGSASGETYAEVHRPYIAEEACSHSGPGDLQSPS